MGKFLVNDVYGAACQEDRSRWLWQAYCGVKSDLNSDHFTKLTAQLANAAETESGIGFNYIIRILSNLSWSVRRLWGLNKRLSYDPQARLRFSGQKCVKQKSESLAMRVSLCLKTILTHDTQMLMSLILNKWNYGILCRIKLESMITC